ncbi:hypothetical protein M4D81_12050 [Paenibacillus sp. p3-SID867]|uniref:hypothetical protein n=1 Tax=Paenibacillus sp. p3-SID867 TaxID=2916363 RepID=UPI0021A8241B|nr:hypothetical protein [Paenibacillus sp. p3-SID867]MCT1399755.1 hypothetical protein [Paenibacillus sp. p3-SID867]
MKINRKYIAILSIAVASVLTVSIILFFTDASNRSGQHHRLNDNMNGQALVQVGSTYITHTHLTAYKNSLAHSTAPLPDEATLLKEMATKELMLQLAYEQGVAASLEDGIQRAKELRKTLETQPRQVQEQHLRILDTMGISEDQYWEDYSPPEYRDMLSIERLVNKLTTDIKSTQPDVITSTQQLKDKLLNTALNEQRIIVLDPDIQLR